MQTFVAIVEEGSLTAAAERLGKALPTIVRSLALLEDALGVRLLQRTTRRMSLTEEGRVYLDHCGRILADIETVEASLSSPDAAPRGALRVTAPVLYGQLKVAPAVNDFLRQYTEMTIDLILLDRVVDMVEEGIDVGVRIAPLSDSSMVAVRVGELRRVVVASPEQLERSGVPEHPSELRTHPVVRFGGLAQTPSWKFSEAGRTISVPVAGPLVCNQAAAAVDACTAGLGFGQFLSYQVESAVSAGALCVVLDEYELPPVPVQLVFAHARLMSPRTRAFVDWMKPALMQATSH